MADNGQVLKVSYVTDKDEGTYECTVHNGVGKPVKARVLVQLRETANKEVNHLFEHIRCYF